MLLVSVEEILIPIDIHGGLGPWCIGWSRSEGLVNASCDAPCLCAEELLLGSSGTGGPARPGPSSVTPVHTGQQSAPALTPDLSGERINSDFLTYFTCFDQILVDKHNYFGKTTQIFFHSVGLTEFSATIGVRRGALEALYSLNYLNKQYICN